MYRLIFRPFFFLFAPERAHAVAMGALALICATPLRFLVRRISGYEHPSLRVDVLGLAFKNPLGIAAGFDKDGKYISALACLGFGHIEVGTVTPRPQEGNPKPRLFRLTKSRALINRMGFNNAGVEMLARRLGKLKRRKMIIGANIGKNKDTPNADAVHDYAACFSVLHPHVDYFTINVSSPNTPGLRALQSSGALAEIITAIDKLNQEIPQRRPILLKIAPDLTDTALDDIAAIARTMPLDGVMICNTTISRDGLQESSETLAAIGDGGMSGVPLRRRAEEVLKYLRDRLPPTTVVIGVGGIDNATSAIERLQAGASLIQIYTGFIYEGPGLIRRILRGMVKEVIE